MRLSGSYQTPWTQACLPSSAARLLLGNKSPQSRSSGFPLFRDKANRNITLISNNQMHASTWLDIFYDHLTTCCFCHLKVGKGLFNFQSTVHPNLSESSGPCSHCGRWNIDRLQLETGYFFSVFCFCLFLFFLLHPGVLCSAAHTGFSPPSKSKEKGSCSSGRW